MSSYRVEFGRVRLWIGALVLGAALAFGATPASASDARSSPEDRQRFVSIARSLEQDPLKRGAKEDRAWALAWLTEAPDVTVNMCADSLGSLLKSDYRYAGEIVLQNMFSMGVLAIEHPETADDPNAQQLAGLEGALNAYRSILRDRPEARSPELEALLRTQSSGGLSDFARKAWTSCSAQE